MMAARSGILHLRRFFQLRLATAGCLPAFQTSISSQELRSRFGAISRTPATLITNMKTSPPYLQHRFLSSVAKDGGSDSRPESTQASNSIEAVNNPDSDTERPADYKPSKRHDLAMLFTCKVCETRSAKTMSRATYETGIVLVRCPKCKNLHLIADRLGWFGEPGSVEDFLEQQGVAVRKGVEETYEFSVEDLKGWTPPGSNDPQSSG